MPQFKLDPCLFIGESAICISNVHDLLSQSKDKAYIHYLAIFLHQACVDLEQEDNTADFLGVRIEQNESGLLEMMQEDLIDHVVEAL